MKYWPSGNPTNGKSRTALAKAAVVIT